MRDPKYWKIIEIDSGYQDIARDSRSACSGTNFQFTEDGNIVIVYTVENSNNQVLDIVGVSPLEQEACGSLWFEMLSLEGELKDKKL